MTAHVFCPNLVCGPIFTCRSFGDPDFKEPLHLVTATPDVIRERMLPGDEFVILASDGLVRIIWSALFCCWHIMHWPCACCRATSL